jgi:hypothetical protein
MDQLHGPEDDSQLQLEFPPADKRHGQQETKKSAMFEGKQPLNNYGLLSSATYTTSGNIVKEYLTKNGRNWADSLVKGKNTGSCAFKSVYVKQTVAQVTDALKSGCTYTSSNEAVVSVSGSTLDIHDYGFAILTGNDGSESVVNVDQVAGQTIRNFSNGGCAYNSDCWNEKTSTQLKDYDEDGKKEYALTESNKTIEGATFTLKSLNPEIIEVKNVVCKIASCAGDLYNNKVWMFQMNSFGDAKIVATAPAVTGYRAMQDTIIFSYTKGYNRITPDFKNVTIPLGGKVEEIVLDTTMKGTKITYTFDGEPTSKYLTRDGSTLVAGDQNAIVTITATVEETELYQAKEVSIVVTIGDASKAVNLAEHQAFLNKDQQQEEEVIEDDAIRPSITIARGLSAQINGNTLYVQYRKAGMVKLEVYDAIGNRVLSQSERYTTGTHSVQLKGLSNGSYVAIVRQGSQATKLRWNKR